MPPSSRASVSLETSFGPDKTTITLQLMHAAGEHSGTLWLTATSPFSSAVCVPICQYATTRWRGRAIVGVGAKKKQKSGRITALAARLGQSPTVAASVNQFHCDVSQATRWFVLRASQWCGSGISRCFGGCGRGGLPSTQIGNPKAWPTPPQICQSCPEIPLINLIPTPRQSYLSSHPLDGDHDRRATTVATRQSANGPPLLAL